MRGRDRAVAGPGRPAPRTIGETRRIGRCAVDVRPSDTVESWTGRSGQLWIEGAAWTYGGLARRLLAAGDLEQR
jgi:hypothetical protein